MSTQTNAFMCMCMHIYIYIYIYIITQRMGRYIDSNLYRIHAGFGFDLGRIIPEGNPLERILVATSLREVLGSEITFGFWILEVVTLTLQVPSI